MTFIKYSIKKWLILPHKNTTVRLSFWSILAIVVFLVILKNSIFGENNDEVKQSVKQESQSPWVKSKWDDMLEYVILKKHKKQLDGYVVCKTFNDEGRVFTACDYTVFKLRQRPLFLHDGEILRAVNGTAKNKVFTHYSDIEPYIGGDDMIDIDGVLNRNPVK